MKTIIITGGAGFIGSHVVRLFVTKYPEYRIVNLDKLTYAGNLENLRDIEEAPNYVFLKADITRPDEVQSAFETYQPDGVIHLAAESHVDRSITDPLSFVTTNVLGTVNLLNAARDLWKGEKKDAQPGEKDGQASNPARDQTSHQTRDQASDHPGGPAGKRFYHVSTDEVYGALGDTGLFTEETPYDPNSPYSASKASSDHFVRAYHETYGLPVVISNCSNNYGPNHFPEKLIPLMIHNILNNKQLPVYGDGKYTRDWLYVVDHARAIDLVFHRGQGGDTYNIGGFNEWKNIDLVKLLCAIMDRKLNQPEGTSEQLITYVKDRPGHDLRYAIDAGKISKELGWKPTVTFEEGLELTVDWYLANQDWLDHVTSGHYRDYYLQQYGQ